MKQKQRFKKRKTEKHNMVARVVAIVCAVLIVASAFLFLFF